MKNLLNHTLRCAATTTALLVIFPLGLAVPAAAAPNSAATSIAAPMAQAEAGTETVWSLVPTAASNGQDRVSLRLEIEPGGSLKDSVVLKNHGKSETSFSVYASDGVITEEGQFDIGGGGTKPEGSGAWINFDDSLPEDGIVTLAAGDSATIGFTLAVPAEATPGDHPAGIVAAVGGTTAKAGELAVESRVGTRIHLRVAGEVQASLAATEVQTHYVGSWNPLVPGKLVTNVRVVNEGNVRLGAVATASAGGIFGLLERDGNEASWRELLPGDSVELETITEGLWPLFWLGGSLEVLPQVVGEDEVENLSVAQVPISAVAIGWSQLISMVVLVGGTLLLVRGRKAATTRREEALEQALEAARAEGAREAAESRS